MLWCIWAIHTGEFDDLEKRSARACVRLRLAHGLSAAALARTVTVTEAAIRAIETGDSKSPSFAVGVRLAEALGVTPRFLASEKDRISRRVLALERRLGPASRIRVLVFHRRLEAAQRMTPLR